MAISSSIFDINHPFYYGPPTFHILHYRTAAILSTAIELILLASGIYGFNSMKHASLGSIPVIFLAILSFAAIISSAIMLYGIFSEKARLITPKIAFIQFEIGILMVIAAITIVVMSVGIDLTNAVFGLLFRIDILEKDFGPIWPFNIAVVCFYWAAGCVWMKIVVQGAYEFILDKHYFSESPNMPIEMTISPR